MPSAISSYVTSIDTIPPGCVLPFAGASAPSGWLLCDGSAVSRTTYSRLFAAISTAHGSGDGSTTFHLPDYRGRFLRGRANGSSNDPDRASRTASNSGGNTGDNVGSVQGNQTAVNSLSTSASSISGSTDTHGGHTHSVSETSGGGGSSRFATGANNGIPGTSISADQATAKTGGAHSHGVSGTAAAQALSGGNETRPINANVNYIIKF